MTSNQSYLEWLTSFVCNKEYSYSNYKGLFNELFDISYHCAPGSIDNNRICDGYSLRNWWLEDAYLDDDSLSYKPCSVLEVLVALAKRCEEDIMDNPEYGNRTGKWFWMMIDNLGVDNCIGDNVDSFYIYNCVQNAMNHNYNPDGTDGGFFVVPNCEFDLRKEDLWSQMLIYLDAFEVRDDYI